MSAPDRHLTATTLRAILVTILLAIALLGVGIFILGYQQITAYSRSTEEIANQAQASNHVVQDLVALRQELDTEASVARDASLMVAQAADYQYQEQIIETVSTKATLAGVTLDNISFISAAVGSAATATTDATTASLSGVKTASATITLKNPVSYAKLLNFFYILQNGVPSLSIKSISLAKSNASGGDGVDCGPLTVEVYIK